MQRAVHILFVNGRSTRVKALVKWDLVPDTTFVRGGGDSIKADTWYDVSVN